MHESWKMPEGEDYSLLLNLIAAIAIRNPSMRRHIHGALAHTARVIGDLVTSSKDRYETTIRQMREAGHAVNENVTYESVKDFHDRGEYMIRVAQGQYFRMEMAGMDAIFYLYHRKWSVLVAADPRHSFVTCDHPVMLFWTKEAGPTRLPPGHGRENTELIAR
jgi:Protein of unknown function (DUF4238)